MIVLDDVTYTYPFASEAAVRNLSIKVSAGEALLVTGPSGCGKSTIVRLLNGLCPHFYKGRTEGSVRVNGKETRACRLHEICADVGTLFQDPEHQFFAMTVEEEIAFVHEWRQHSPKAICSAVETAAMRFGLTHLLKRSLFHLSEGEKQKVVLASIVSLGVRVLVLDEPTANLDPESTMALADTLIELKRSGVTILVVDHRLYWLKDVVDRVMVMNHGEMVAEGDFAILVDGLLQEIHGLRKSRLDDPRKGLTPVNEMKGHLRVENMAFAYRNGPELFRNVNICLPRGVTALLGENGSGKTTLARLLTGLAPMRSGRIFLDKQPIEPRRLLGCASVVLQNVDHQLYMKTVHEELAVSLHGALPGRREAIVEEMLNMFALGHLSDRHPQSLSGGEKQRLVIACGMARHPDVLILDEPTSGLDARNLQRIVLRVKTAAEQGACVLLISHDLELIEAACTHCLHLPIGDNSLPPRNVPY